MKRGAVIHSVGNGGRQRHGVTNWQLSSNWRSEDVAWSRYLYKEEKKSNWRARLPLELCSVIKEYRGIIFLVYKDTGIQSNDDERGDVSFAGSQSIGADLGHRHPSSQQCSRNKQVLRKRQAIDKLNGWADRISCICVFTDSWTALDILGKLRRDDDGTSPPPLQVLISEQNNLF